jgi:superfamily II DNA or RNA helicase
MLIKIVDNHYLFLDQITAQQGEIVYQHFSAKDPDAMYIVDTLNQSWDGWYRKYDRRQQRMALPFLDEMLFVCHRYGWPVDVLDYRPATLRPDEAAIRSDILPGITLYEFQLKALRASLDHHHGIFWHTTGAGKTELMAALIKLHRCPTLIIAEKVIVVDQIKRVLELRKVAEEVGVFYSGKTPEGQLVCVGSVQSITSPTKPRREQGETPEEFGRRSAQYYARHRRSSSLQAALLPSCGMLLVDECDLATSQLYAPLFKKSEAVRRYGFTGSMCGPDKPLQRLILQERLGSVIDKTSRRELERLGRIVPIKYVMVAYGEGRKLNRAAYDIAVKELESDQRFIGTIAGIVRAHSQEKTVVLVEHVAFGNSLAAAIPGSAFICGETPRTERWQAIRAFEDGQLRCLIGGKVIKRGLDLKGGCNNLIITIGMSDLADFEQRIGRAVRRNPMGYARVFDFLFLHNHYLYRHSRIRLKYLVGEMDYAATVLFPSIGVGVSGQALIDARFNVDRARKSSAPAQ